MRTLSADPVGEETGAPVPPELVALTTSLVRKGSEPLRALSAVELFLTRSRIPSRRLFPKTDYPVLIAGSLERRLGTVLATHVDVVPPEERPDAAPGTVKGDRLYGRGALDMRGGLALSLLLLRGFYWSSPQPPPLTVVVTTDEEKESRGAWRLTDQGMLVPELVLVPEPTWERVALGAVGRRSWTVSFTGEGGHAEGNFQRTASPASALAHLVARLPADFTPLSLSTLGTGEVTLPLRAEARVDQILKTREGEHRAEEIFTMLTELAERRYPGLQGRFGLVRRTSPWPPPYKTDPTHALVRRFLATAVRDGHAAERIVEQAVGDFNAFGSRWPTIVFGPSGGGAHGPGEWVDLASLGRCWKVYQKFLAGIFEGRRPLR